MVHLVDPAAPARLVRLEGQVLTKVLPIVEIQTLPKVLLIKLLIKYNLEHNSMSPHRAFA